jgi:hypothetical protein
MLLQAWFITAIALPALSTTTVRTINKGVFIATSLRLPPTHRLSKLNRGSNEPAMNARHR